ncbi:MAG: hypothetical protein HC856_09260 [Pseudanabaena sp. RU_4_16]|nr:hypothetical protein [Pseudanabaena sp. RU_4_16]
MIIAAMPETLRRRHTTWTLRARRIPMAGTELSVTPDAVFALEFRDSGRRNYFLVEADRATMPVERRSPTRSAFTRKLLAYWHAHRAKQHTAQWGIPGFRVLTVATSEERIASLLAAVKEVTNRRGSNVFLFASWPALASSNPLTIAWISDTDQPARLIQT